MGTTFHVVGPRKVKGHHRREPLQTAAAGCLKASALPVTSQSQCTAFTQTHQTQRLGLDCINLHVIKCLGV